MPEKKHNIVAQSKKRMEPYFEKLVDKLGVEIYSIRNLSEESAKLIVSGLKQEETTRYRKCLSYSLSKSALNKAFKIHENTIELLDKLRKSLKNA